jgi:hypothetical protein
MMSNLNTINLPQSSPVDKGMNYAWYSERYLDLSEHACDCNWYYFLTGDIYQGVPPSVTLRLLKKYPGRIHGSLNLLHVRVLDSSLPMRPNSNCFLLLCMTVFSIFFYLHKHCFLSFMTLSPSTGQYHGGFGKGKMTNS